MGVDGKARSCTRKRARAVLGRAGDAVRELRAVFARHRTGNATVMFGLSYAN